MVELPVTVPAFAIIRQVVGLMRGDRSKVTYRNSRVPQRGELWTGALRLDRRARPIEAAAGARVSAMADSSGSP
jgi:hypothetical protein